MLFVIFLSHWIPIRLFLASRNNRKEGSKEIINKHNKLNLKLKLNKIEEICDIS
jgi:hypothetical protein